MRVHAVSLVGATAFAMLAAGGFAAWWNLSWEADRHQALPERLEPDYGYVGSDACRSCHPDQHASWDASYHSKMTQLPTPETVQAPFDVTVHRRGWPYHFERDGDEFWVDMVDPDWESEQGRGHDFVADDPPRARKQIVMVTGSHHKQAFWVTSSKREVLLRVPWSYRIDQQRWIPLEADYLAPPHSGARGGTWNDNCIQCHAVAGQPRAHRNGFDSHVAELGIACEACHGPGGKHVRLRERGGPGDSVGEPHLPQDDPIVNPLTETAERSSQICGQCHVVSVIKDYPQFLQSGYPYRPGHDLRETMYLLRYVRRPKQRWLRAVTSQDPTLMDSRFWKDGTIRSTGREFNGLIETPCYQRGELSCISCHSMHQYVQAEDQLGRSMDQNRACTQCHTEYAEDLQAHTHHSPGSSGSLCYNCHMPHTTYGLFKAVRAHKIDAPSAASSYRTGRPNACNLCHLDKTLSWSAQHLHQWYGQPQVELSDQHEEVAASLIWLLSGDAAQRAILAWHFGWTPARKASGEQWLARMALPLIYRYFGAALRAA